MLNKNNKYTIKATNMPSQSKEYANQNTKYAISTKRIRQPKHQVRHLNQKSTPTKTPSTPSQSKEYATKTPNTQSQSKEYANIDLRCFVVRQLLLRIYALFGVQFEVLKIALAYKK